MSRVPTMATGAIAVTLSLVALAPEAWSADLYRPPRQQPEPKYETRVFDRTPWTGAYIGLSIGQAWGETRIEEVGGNFNFDTSGTLFGGYAGYTWQSGNFVLGGEAELTGGSVSGSGPRGATIVSQDLNYMAAVRGRAGVLLAPALYVYGMAGVAWAEMDITARGFDRTQDFTGYQLGAGGEYRFTRNFSLRVDYIYTGFGAERRDFPGFRESIDPDFHTVRAGLTLRF